MLPQFEIPPPQKQLPLFDREGLKLAPPVLSCGQDKLPKIACIFAPDWMLPKPDESHCSPCVEQTVSQFWSFDPSHHPIGLVASSHTVWLLKVNPASARHSDSALDPVLDPVPVFAGQAVHGLDERLEPL